MHPSTVSKHSFRYQRAFRGRSTQNSEGRRNSVPACRPDRRSIRARYPLSRLSDGRLASQFKQPCRDGATHVVFRRQEQRQAGDSPEPCPKHVNWPAYRQASRLRAMHISSTDPIPSLPLPSLFSVVHPDPPTGISAGAGARLRRCGSSVAAWPRRRCKPGPLPPRVRGWHRALGRPGVGARR